MTKYRNDLNQVVTLFKALSDEQRVRALLALQHGEICVCQLVELLQLAPSTVSKHMSILKQAGLVDSRKTGRWVYYRLADTSPTEYKRAIDWILEAFLDEGVLLSLEWDQQVQEDTKRLKAILEMDPEELCRKQCQC